MAQTYYTSQWADKYNKRFKENAGFLSALGNVLSAPIEGLGALIKDSAGVAPPTESSPVVTSTNTTDLLPITKASIFDEYSNRSSNYGYGGGGRTNLSNIFSSLEQGAETERQIAKDTYESRREDLLTSLKRFQENNARDVQNQQKAYLSNQASLEAAIAQADRQNRINAAARGLGGSGLQQLAQLQNLLSQGQTISNMATENQDAMDALRRALAEETEKTETQQQRALTDYNNTLREIASNLAMNKSNYEYQASEAALNRQATAANYAAAQNAANENNASQASQLLAMNQENLEKALRTLANTDDKKISNLLNPYSEDGKTPYGIKDRNTIKQYLYDAAQQNARTILANNYINDNTNTSINALNNISALLNMYR